MLDKVNAEKILPLAGVGATGLLILGIFYSSGQASLIGNAYMTSFTYSDTLIQAFEPLKQLVFLGTTTVFLFFACLILFFLVIWIKSVFDLLWCLTIGEWKIKKRSAHFSKIEDQLHIETVSAATMQEPSAFHLKNLEDRFVSLAHWRQAEEKADEGHREYISLLKTLVSGRWYKLNSDSSDNKWSLEAIADFFKENRYKRNLNLITSSFFAIPSIIIFFYLKTQTNTNYLSWLLVATFYILIAITLSIAKFSNPKELSPTKYDRFFGYTVFCLILLSFMFLLGRDDIRAKSAQDNYILVGLATGPNKCGKNLAGNGSVVIIEEETGIVLIPWSQIHSLSYGKDICS